MPVSSIASNGDDSASRVPQKLLYHRGREGTAMGMQTGERSAWAAVTATLMIGLAVAPQPACADPVADFYRGRTVHVLVGVAAGGDYDVHARLIARHIGKYIPGNPTVIPENMTGAGGLKMANYLYEIAPPRTGRISA
jgi:tripartite-type tricarboxylate transporter receptor subunit TctC